MKKNLLDVFRIWLDKGVDGFRLDVFNAYFKHAEFLDNPKKFGIIPFDRLLHVNDIDQPELLPLLSEIRDLSDSYSERYVIGETYLDSPGKASRYCGADYLHAALHFGLVKCRWRARHFLKAVQDWYGALSPESWPTFVMNNHDVPRSATRFGRGEDDERLKVAAAFLLTQRGTPFLYYGEEIGMRDISLSRHQIKDKVGRYFWPFYKGRDGCRSPMQWDNTKNAGFSSIEPWLPIHSNYHHRNVELQQQDPNSLLNFHRDLINLRKSVPALQKGLFLPMNHEPLSILAYVRQTKDQLVLVALNFSRRSLNLVLDKHLAKFSWELLISSTRDSFNPVKSNLINLEPYEVLILMQTSK